MSFRKSCANWQWRYFYTADMPDVLENFTGFIDETITLPDGSSVPGKAFEFADSGMVDMLEILPERPKALSRFILTADFCADSAGSLVIGFAADWYWTLRANGKLLQDARKSGNSEYPVAPTNHLQTIDFCAGRNQIVLDVICGNRAVDVACKIMDIPGKLCLQYKPFVSFPDSSENAVSVIFSGNYPSVAAVDYRLQGTEEWQRVYDNIGGQMRHDRSVHHIRLRNLQPASVYEYRAVLVDRSRVLCDVLPDEICTFRTAPSSGDFRFSVTADLQDPASRTDYLKGLLGSNNTFKPDFFAFCGDLLWTSDFELSVMDEFIVPYREITDNKLPLVMVRGNHEIYGVDSNRYFDYFTSPEPGREAYYMFRWGKVCFIVLDFCDDDGWIEPPSTRQFHNFEPYIAEQAAWLKNAVNLPMCRDAEFRIVLAHGIPVGDAQKYMPGHVRQVIDPVFGGKDPQVQIHLWLGGHIHRPFRSIPLQNACYSMLPPSEFQGKEPMEKVGVNYNFPVVITGGPTRKLGDNMQFTSIDVEVTGDKLTVHSCDRYQQEFDCFAISKDGVVSEISRDETFKYYEY